MQWVCEVCGFVHDDDEPPGACPVCGAPRGKFSEHFEDDGNGHDGARGSDGMDDFDRDLFADYEDES